MDVRVPGEDRGSLLGNARGVVYASPYALDNGHRLRESELTKHERSTNEERNLRLMVLFLDSPVLSGHTPRPPCLSIEPPPRRPLTEPGSRRHLGVGKSRMDPPAPKAASPNWSYLSWISAPPYGATVVAYHRVRARYAQRIVLALFLNITI